MNRNRTDLLDTLSVISKMFERVPYGCSVWTPQHRFAYANDRLRMLASDPVENHCFSLKGRSKACEHCPARSALRQTDPVCATSCIPDSAAPATIHLSLRSIGYRGVLQLALNTERMLDSTQIFQRPLIWLCAWCKCRAGDSRNWERIERFLSHHGIDVTHGICARCHRELVDPGELRTDGLAKSASDIQHPPLCGHSRPNSRTAELHGKSLHDQLQAAITAHATWKSKLKSALTESKTSLDIATIKMDDQCEFGRWLREVYQTTKHSTHYGEVARLHAEFHVRAADIVERIKRGEIRASAIGTVWKNASAALTRAMKNWIRSNSC